MSRKTDPKPQWSERKRRWEVRVSLGRKRDGVWIDNRELRPLPGIPAPKVVRRKPDWYSDEPTDPKFDANYARAVRAARQINADIRGGAVVSVAAGETCSDWFKRFHDVKEAQGRSSVADMRGRAAKWILPTIGTKPMTAITREDIEAIVRTLDRAIIAWQNADGERGEGRLSPSSAANVWGDLVHGFDEAVRAKDATLRVLATSPTTNVRGPEAGADREGPILYSDEIVRLLEGRAVDPGAKDVPVYRRLVYALALYTMARRSELAALTVGDVDLVHGTIMINKQTDRKKSSETKKTKTKKTREIDIEPNALPLVQRLIELVGGKDATSARLLRVPPPEDCAELLRKDLWTVGVRRDALHTKDSTRTVLVFHDLRDTGLTHMAVRGDSPIAIQWRGGHTDFKTTQGYIDRGRVEARRIGQPLPPIPARLLLETPENKPRRKLDRTGDPGLKRAKNRVIPNTLATPTGIEPVLPT